LPFISHRIPANVIDMQMREQRSRFLRATARTRARSEITFGSCMSKRGMGSGL